MWRREQQTVHSVTSAASPHSVDLAKRQRNYIIAMSIRLLCFILAIVLPFGPITWVLFAGAIVLPYVAVLLANAVGGDDPGLGPVTPEYTRPSLTSTTSYPLPGRRPGSGSRDGRAG